MSRNNSRQTARKPRNILKQKVYKNGFFPSASSESYEVVVIGAGIAGLICANYLAKAGLKTLLVEQHYACGGCCSSFRRDGFTFDSGAHSLGSCRPGGQIHRVLQELEILGQIEFKRSEPSDTVINGNVRVDFRGNTLDMVEALTQHFPSEYRRVHEFFRELDGFEVTNLKSFLKYYARYKVVTFRDMLDDYFREGQLKAILCAFLGNLGLASTQIAALPAIAMFKEFVLDGGYYVTGGMQNFVDFLANNFRQLGGELKLQTTVTKIRVRRSCVQGIETSQGDFIRAKNVVSTAGLRQTFFRLVGETQLPRWFVTKVDVLKPSVSAVIVYLGVKGSANTQGWGRSLWYIPHGNPDEIYGRVFAGGSDQEAEALLLAFPSHFDGTLAPAGHHVVTLFTVASFENMGFWKAHKATFSDRMIERASELIPGLRKAILVHETASPLSLYNYTLNDNGAMYGLASTPDQFKTSVMPQDTLISGLYLAGHWATVGAGQGGTPMAAFAGRNAAQLILGQKVTKATQVRRVFNFKKGVSV